MRSNRDESSIPDNHLPGFAVAAHTPYTKQQEQDASTPTRSFDYSMFASILLDCLSIGCSMLAALVFSSCVNHRTWRQEDVYRMVVLSIQYILTFVLFGRMHFLYSHSHTLLHVRETASILRVSVYSLALISIELVLGQLFVPGGLLLGAWVLSTCFVLSQKHLTRSMLARWKARQLAARNVLILGTNSEARRVFSFLLNSPDLQLIPVAFCQERSGDPHVIYSHDYSFKAHAPVYSQQLDGALLKQLKVTKLFVADPTLSPQRLDEIRVLAAEHSVELSIVGSAHFSLSSHLLSLRMMDGLLVSSISFEFQQRGTYEACKRLIDCFSSALIIALTSPLWVVVAALIKGTSKGPVFFRQQRIGRSGKPFKMYKFRSMYAHAPKYGRSPESTSDPRITPIGRFLRKTSLDELPQLLNVLKGNMTMVGPRPEMPYIVEQYDARQAQRLTVKQGLTGIWQLSADRRHSIHESVEYDLYYIENRGIFLDLAILLHTVAFAMKGT